MRALADLTDDELSAAYEPPRLPWLRLNFVATVDGAAQGGDGLSKSINNDADGRVFGMLRERCDVVVVGAGTVRAEGYRPNPRPFVVVTRSGAVPPSLLEGDTSRVYLATAAAAPHLAQSQRLLGDRVLVLGDHTPDLGLLCERLAGLGFEEVLCEGGPHLARDLLAAGLVDELCATVVPRLLAGDHLRIAAGPPVDVPLRLAGLLEQDGTLLQRWLVQRSAPATGQSGAGPAGKGT
jgi:riboflavin biosynthesis pyrimidine reductase